MPHEFRVLGPSSYQKFGEQLAQDPRSPLPGQNNNQQQHPNLQNVTPRPQAPHLFTAQQQPKVTGVWGAIAARRVPGTKMSTRYFSPR